VLIFFASLTSTISISEIPITFLIEEYKLSRVKATLFTAAVTLVMSTLCALSFNVLDNVKLFGMNLFDLMNYAASNVFMLIGGLFTAIYVGWFLDRKIVRDQFTNGGRLRGSAQPYVIFVCAMWRPFRYCSSSCFSQASFEPCGSCLTQSAWWQWA